MIGCLEPISSCALQDVYAPKLAAHRAGDDPEVAAQRAGDSPEVAAQRAGDDPEVAAQRAGEELLAEEEHLKAQAAAKKAKKQRQKAKKQQAQAALQTGPALAPEPASSEAMPDDNCMPDAPVPVPSTQGNQLTGSEPSCSGQQAPSDGHFAHFDGHEQANGQQALAEGHVPYPDGHEQANGQQATPGGHQQAADAPAASAQVAEPAVQGHSHTDQQQASQPDQASADPCSPSLSHASASAGTLNTLAPLATACPDEMADSWQVASGPEAIQMQRREGCDQIGDHQFLQALFCCPLTHVSLASQASHQCAKIMYQASSHNC